ncbi:MAG: phage tail spike protein, partial [Enterococcus gilvus]
MKPRIYKPTEKDFFHNGLGILKDATRCDVTEEANGRYEIEVEYPLDTRFKEFFENGYQIKAKPNDQEKYMIFEIKNTYQDTNNNNILIYGVTRTYKLGNREVQRVEIKSQSGPSAMQSIMDGMDSGSDVTLFSDIQTVSSTLFEARNVLNCIAGEQGSMLQFWGGEIKHEPFKLSLLQRRGRDNVGTVRYGKDLTGLKIKLDWSSIVTRVLPYADLQNGDDGQTKRIYGTAVDSDLIKNYPDVYARHIQFTEEQGARDLESLNKVSAKYFKSINPGSDQPKISIELELDKLTDSEEAKEFAKLRNYGLFDTFKVYHKLYNIKIDSKITTVVYDSLNEKVKKIHAGEARMSFFTKQNYDLQETIKSLTKKGYMSDFVDYITNLINGVEGGSVLQYPKNRPHSTYYLDTDSVETAKDVMVQNNKGIGFSRTGWKGPFTTAWTLDGVLTLGMGMLRIGIEGTDKFMINTVKGLEFFTKEGSLGRIGTTTKSFSGMPSNGGQETTKALSLELEDGEFIQLSDGSKSGLYIPNHKITTGTGGDIFLGSNEVSGGVIIWTPQANIAIGGKKAEGTLLIQAAKGISLIGDVNVNGKLTINGEQVYPGQGSGGGGGWNGTYPPEITSQADKFAWELYSILLSKGYSKSAACGILGNVQGEVGASMNPDTEQVNGPAYGCVQWDGSAYPLVGSTTWNGREYVQRLMDAARINDDYKTMKAQAQLIEWCNFNGQWIGQVSPTSVTEFKKLGSPQQAAYAFELNFERPAAAHPERQGWALEWYNKFKD